MKKEILDYICSLHGYLIRLKEFHWSTDNDAEHKLCDEISSKIGSLEDEFAETAMGHYGEKIKVNELKPLLPRAEELKPMLKELREESVDLKKKYLLNTPEAGLSSVVDVIIATAEKYEYRSTQI